MKIKTNWQKYIHSIRKKEIEIIFSKFVNNSFNNGLEIGAGDGFQSELISAHTQHLISTEYNEERLKKRNTGKIKYKICDAEIIDKYFDAQSFELIFASNVLEHLKKREKALQRIHIVLKDDGILIIVVPNRFAKLCNLLLFYPNQFFELIEVITKPDGFRKIYRRLISNSNNLEKSYQKTAAVYVRNNRKSPPNEYIKSLLYPFPHGEYSGHLQELLQYSKKNWRKLVENNEFEVAATLKMPVASGYGFGLDWVRNIMGKIGLCSSFAFIVYKSGSASGAQRYWSQ